MHEAQRQQTCLDWIKPIVWACATLPSCCRALCPSLFFFFFFAGTPLSVSFNLAFPPPFSLELPPALIPPPSSRMADWLAVGMLCASVLGAGCLPDLVDTSGMLLVS